MESNEKNSVKGSNIQPAGGYPQQPGYYPPEDEINLIDLVKVLFRQKYIISGLTIAATIGAVLYALIATPVYKAEAVFLPPVASDVQVLTVQGVQGVPGVGVDAAYKAFKRNLDSRKLLKHFFENHGIIDVLAPERSEETSRESVFQSFRNMIHVKTDKESLSFSIEWEDPEQASEWVNQYVALTSQKTVDQLVFNVRDAINNRIRYIEYTIASKRKMARERREDKIAVLKEALGIAKSLNIEDRFEVSTVVQNSDVVNVNAAATPLYYRGSKQLTAEIESLVNRKSDDPFISGLRNQQEELTRLRTISIDKSQIRPVTIDQPAYPPDNRIKPNRRLIVILGFVCGLMLGIFAAFFYEFLKNNWES